MAVSHIIESCPDFLRESIGVNDRTPLHLAANVGPAIGEAMLRLGAEVDIDNPGYSPIFEAAREGPRSTVAMLLHHGANANYVSTGGTTPLFWTATSRRTDRKQVVDLLCRHGAIWNLHSSLYMEEDCISRKLLSEGPTSLTKSPFSSGVLTTAVLTNRPLDIVRAILSYGANPNGDPSGVPPLVGLLGHADCNLEMVRLLLDNGADPNARSAAGNTPLLHHKSSFSNPAVIELLTCYGAHE